MEILAALDAAETDIEAVRYIEFSEETLPQVMEELKQEARRKLQNKISA